MSRTPRNDLFPAPPPDAVQVARDQFALKAMIISISLLAAIGVLCVTVVVILAPAQSVVFNTAIMGFLVPIIGAMFTYLVNQNRRMEHALNARLSQWMTQMEKTAGRQREIGKAEGHAEAVARVHDQSGVKAPAGPIEVIVTNPPDLPVPTEIVERPEGD